MENWQKYYDEANSYSKGAAGAFKKAKLGSLVVYNLASLAIENYLTALCVSKNTLPEHSSISSMIRQLEKYMEVPAGFTDEARFLNKFMNFCSLEVLETIEPSQEDLARMLGFVADIKAFCDKEFTIEQPSLN